MFPISIQDLASIAGAAAITIPTNIHHLQTFLQRDVIDHSSCRVEFGTATLREQYPQAAQAAYSWLGDSLDNVPTPIGGYVCDQPNPNPLDMLIYYLSKDENILPARLICAAIAVALFMLSRCLKSESTFFGNAAILAMWASFLASYAQNNDLS